MKYLNGNKCWGGSARSFTVTFQCGIKHQIVDVAESTQCEYTMIFATPLARDEITAKESFLGSVPVQQTPVVNEICQVKTINGLCQPLVITVKFNPSWNTINKRGWCQQATTYFCCLKSRLDKCPQQEVQNQFQQVEHYLQSQININCPGGIDGCSRHSTDARCKIGLVQSNS
ncbi:unnamed protein product, partial [Rotaria magnacalcarata]